MIDEQVDREFKRIAIALTGRAPDAVAFDADARHKPVAWSLARVSAAAFAAVFTVGAATLILLSRSDDTPPTSGEGSRWEWILAGTVATPDPELRIADPAQTPEALFDYTRLGVEQRLIVIPDAPVPALPIPDQSSLAPFVQVGGVEGTVIVGHLFWSSSVPFPTGAHDTEGSPISITPIPVICLAIGSTTGPSSIGCDEVRDPLPADGIIGLIEGGPTASGVPQGRVIVTLSVPRDTAVVVLTLDDGRSFVQRPLVGIAIFVISDLGTAGIESAAALDSLGESLIFQDFSRMWAELRASEDADTTP